MSAPVDSERKGHKRKLADTFTYSNAVAGINGGEKETITVQVRRLLSIIKVCTQKTPDTVDRVVLRQAAHSLAELSKSEENVDTVVSEGGISHVVPLLTFFPAPSSDSKDRSSEDVEKESCFILGLLAIKPEHQHSIADMGALSGLVGILKRHTDNIGCPMPGASVVRRAADAITNLAHENIPIKSRVRAEGGIPPLVVLLEAYDAKVQRAAAGALRTLAFKNEENKNLIVDCGALSTLIQMLRAEDMGIHYEAVGVIGNLVHSSVHIKRQVLEEGALQPVIGLLSSSCNESQREAALLLGQFATTEPDYKARIVQRGAVPPLITMLGAADSQLKEMAAFALGRLAQNRDNQAGIMQAGGLQPLLELLQSKQGTLQHNAAFALYGLADNEDNVAEIIRQGGVSLLQEADLIVQASKDCVQKTIKRLEDKIQGNVLKQILYAMHSSQATDKTMQQRVAVALAWLGKEADLRQSFVDRRGLDVLLELLTDQRRDASSHKEAAAAIFELAKKIPATAAIDCAPAEPPSHVYLGEKYVNNQTLSDVTFLVEGKEFYAHRIALLASSDIFRAMFDGHYKEKEASIIPVPNISFRVFESMMRAIYTKSTEVTSDIAEELLRAADQYMLDGLKHLCEESISQGLTMDNLTETYDLAENFNAPQLGRRCALFALEHYVELSEGSPQSSWSHLMLRMMPKLKSFLTEELVKINVPTTPCA
ncbi:hypothetical protein WJX77_012429 [Trebouxia sp. C0004]